MEAVVLLQLLPALEGALVLIALLEEIYAHLIGVAFRGA